MHRDIKLDNIMFAREDSLTAKLVDFGFAEPINRLYLGSRSGTPGYVPPEVFALQPYTEKGDVFSLGAVLYAVHPHPTTKQLVSGYSLFVGRDVRQVTAANRRCKVSFTHKCWKQVSRKCKHLLLAMLQPDAALRYDCSDVLQCDWLLDYTNGPHKSPEDQGVMSPPGSRGCELHSGEFCFEVTPRGPRSIHFPSYNASRQSLRTTPTASKKGLDVSEPEHDHGLSIDMEDNSTIESHNIQFLEKSTLFNQPKKP